MTDVDHVQGNAIAPKPHERFIASLQRRADIEGGQLGAQVSASQMDKILIAETADEVWDADEGGTFSGQDLVDVELRFLSLTIAPSSDEFDASLGVYVNVKCMRLDSGEEIILNTGADKIITKLVRFESLGVLPVEGVIRAVKTPKGSMLKLRPLPRRATPGTVQE